MNWNAIQSIRDIEEITAKSYEQPCLVFKHSTRCSISFIAKHRLEQNWDFETAEIQPFYLDLIQYREVSNFIAERFQVHHESPQILLIQNGECTFDASHLDIQVVEIRQALPG